MRRLALTLAAIAVVVGACGSGSSIGDDSAAATAVPTTETPAPTGAATSLGTADPDAV